MNDTVPIVNYTMCHDADKRDSIISAVPMCAIRTLYSSAGLTYLGSPLRVGNGSGWLKLPTGIGLDP